MKPKMMTTLRDGKDIGFKGTIKEIWTLSISSAKTIKYWPWVKITWVDSVSEVTMIAKAMLDSSNNTMASTRSIMMDGSMMVS